MLLMLILLSDIDECSEDDPCAIFNGTCINIEGDYLCECKSGFQETEDGKCRGEFKSFKRIQTFFQSNLLPSHSDIDECSVTTTCDQETTTCRNLFGDHECVCLEGYVKNDTENLHSSCKGFHRTSN